MAGQQHVQPNAIGQTKENWNNWVANERDRAPGDYIAAWFRKAADSALNTTKDIAGVVGARIDQLNAGKRILDEGGPPAEEVVYAKTVASKAVAADRDVLDRLTMLVRMNREEASFTTDNRKAQTCLDAAKMYGRAGDHLGDLLPDTPSWGSDTERDAGALMQVRVMKADFGNTISTAAEAVVGAAASKLGGSGRPAASSGSPSNGQPSVEDLMLTLFKLHDLNNNGVLEVEELVQLNKKIAMLHHGKDTDKLAVEAKYKSVFRDKLDNQGKPVPYEVFRRYMKQVLDDLDKDPRGQIMMLEQFCAEAESAREVFAFMSFASVSDEPFLAQLGIDRQASDELLFPSAKAAADEMAAAEPVGVTVAPPTPAQREAERRRAEEARLAEQQKLQFAQQQQQQQEAPPVWGSGVEQMQHAGSHGNSQLQQTRQHNTPVQTPSLGRGSPGERGGQWQQQPPRAASAQSTHSHSAGPGGGGYGGRDFAQDAASALPPPPPAAVQMLYQKGSLVQVWSNSKNMWLDAVISEAFDRSTFTEGYAVPAGSYKVSSKSGHKWIMPEHVQSQLRSALK